jgi:hypothetical protein
VTKFRSLLLISGRVLYRRFGVACEKARQAKPTFAADGTVSMRDMNERTGQGECIALVDDRSNLAVGAVGQEREVLLFSLTLSIAERRLY